MEIFKFNFVSWGQFENLNLDIDLLTFIQNISMLSDFFGNLILAIIAQMLCVNHLNVNASQHSCTVTSQCTCSTF